MTAMQIRLMLLSLVAYIYCVKFMPSLLKAYIQLFSKTFIGHYMRKSACNTVILKLLTQDCSRKFSRMVAPGVNESVY